jgi:hypothetical protein
MSETPTPIPTVFSLRKALSAISKDIVKYIEENGDKTVCKSEMDTLLTQFLALSMLSKYGVTPCYLESLTQPTSQQCTPKPLPAEKPSHQSRAKIIFYTTKILLGSSQVQTS